MPPRNVADVIGGRLSQGGDQFFQLWQLYQSKKAEAAADNVARSMKLADLRLRTQAGGRAERGLQLQEQELNRRLAEGLYKRSTPEPLGPAGSLDELTAWFGQGLVPDMTIDRLAELYNLRRKDGGADISGSIADLRAFGVGEAKKVKERTKLLEERSKLPAFDIDPKTKERIPRKFADLPPISTPADSMQALIMSGFGRKGLTPTSTAQLWGGVDQAWTQLFNREMAKPQKRAGPPTSQRIQQFGGAGANIQRQNRELTDYAKQNVEGFNEKTPEEQARIIQWLAKQIDFR